MTSRKAIWAGMDRLAGKKEGSSYEHLEKERARQGLDSHKVRVKAKALRNRKECGTCKKSPCSCK